MFYKKGYKMMFLINAFVKQIFKVYYKWTKISFLEKINR